MSVFHSACELLPYKDVDNVRFASVGAPVNGGGEKITSDEARPCRLRWSRIGGFPQRLWMESGQACG